MPDSFRSPVARILRARVGRALAAVILALLPIACGSATPENTSTDPPPSPSGTLPLAGTEWVLIELRGEAPAGDAWITLVVGEASAGGSSGCNLYGGTPTVTLDTFTLAEIHVTLRACEDPRLMDQESDYLALLGRPSAYEVRGDTLVLETDGGGRLVFRATAD
jgi:heat shock protein HslJ